MSTPSGILFHTSSASSARYWKAQFACWGVYGLPNTVNRVPGPFGEVSSTVVVVCSRYVIDFESTNNFLHAVGSWSLGHFHEPLFLLKNGESSVIS